MKRVLLLCAVLAVAVAQTGSTPRESEASGASDDLGARTAALESKVEALGGEVQKLQQKIDGLITQVRDLNTKMNLVLLAGSVLFGAMITQVAGALGARRNSGANEESVRRGRELDEMRTRMEELRIQNADLRAKFENMGTLQDLERRLIGRETELRIKNKDVPAGVA